MQGNIEKTRLLVIAGGVPSPESSPTRSWALAESLSRDFDVILAVPAVAGISHPSFAVVYYNRRNAGLLARDSDMVIFGARVLREHPQLGKAGRLLIGEGAAVREGRFDGVSAGADPEALGPDQWFLLRPAARQPGGPGLGYYLRRLAYHLRTGGPRQAGSRGSAAIRRKARGG